MSDDTTAVGTDTSIADLNALVEEVGASYPLLAYTQQLDEEYDETTALDPIILAGLVSPSA